ncbi:MAG: gamma-glutamylcyclotransferase [Rhodospirillaceae bacterium]|nr:gamma-glutamylcyclotransferase [Rhodospirillaceae bacterium]
MTLSFAPAPATDPAIPADDFWIFGYGSLMWRPGFPFVETRGATLNGFHRDLCLTSIHYRGTRDKPGLVCGLCPGGECKGRAFRIAPDDVGRVVAYLDERELISYIYIPRHLPIELDSGRAALARVYVADDGHAQFAGGWSVAKKAEHVAQGVGSEGRSLDYLANIVAHMEELGIVDANLETLLAQAQVLDSAGS